jgi:hypothetical protein
MPSYADRIGLSFGFVVSEYGGLLLGWQHIRFVYPAGAADYSIQIFLHEIVYKDDSNKYYGLNDLRLE